MFLRKPSFQALAVFLTLLPLALSAGKGTTGKCFLPNGKTDDNDLPYFSNDAASRCCAPDEFCSTNKLCVLKEGATRFARGSCLDKNYGTTCPTFCKGIDDSAKVDLFQCGDAAQGEFCCDEGKGNACCQDPSKILKLGVGTTFNESSIEPSSVSMLSMSKARSQSAGVRSSTSSKESGTSSFKARSTSLAVAPTSRFSSSVPQVSSFNSPAALPSIPAQATPSSATSIMFSTSVVVLTSAVPSSSPQSISSTISTLVSISIIDSSPGNISLSAPKSTYIPQTATSQIPNSIPISSQRALSTTISQASALPDTAPSTTSIVPDTIESAILSSQSLSSPLPSTSSSSSLSTAAGIGIAIGIFALVALMTGLGYFLYRKRSQDRFSRRFEKSLDPREQRENRGSWGSKLSFSRRPIHISVPIVSRSGSSLSNRSVEMPLQGSTTSPQQRNQIPESGTTAPPPMNPALPQPQPLSNTSSFTAMGIPPAYQSSAPASIPLVPSFNPNPGPPSPVRMIMRPTSNGSLHAMKINGRAGGEEIPGRQKLERSPPSEIYNRMLEDVKSMPF